MTHGLIVTKRGKEGKASKATKINILRILRKKGLTLAQEVLNSKTVLWRERE
jgi:hypothetical protein